MTAPLFITLTMARTGSALVVNLGCIIDVEGHTYPDPRVGAPNVWRPASPATAHGSLITIKGRRAEDNPALVEENPQDILNAMTAAIKGSWAGGDPGS